ncbi:MAG: hypothetical protein KKB20_27980 [Proteobacteria bacterium]|nr:hypothetical protein [Pseudomonadota bacterium]
MFYTADMLGGIDNDRSKVLRTAPNFRTKPDRARIAPISQDNGARREKEEQPHHRDRGEELDTYV